MLARPTRDATPPPPESAAELQDQLALLQAKIAQAQAKEQHDADERAHYEGHRVLAPASPSPRELGLNWAGSGG